MQHTPSGRKSDLAHFWCRNLKSVRPLAPYLWTSGASHNPPPKPAPLGRPARCPPPTSRPGRPGGSRRSRLICRNRSVELRGHLLPYEFLSATVVDGSRLRPLYGRPKGTRPAGATGRYLTRPLASSRRLLVWMVRRPSPHAEGEAPDQFPLPPGSVRVQLPALRSGRE